MKSISRTFATAALRQRRQPDGSMVLQQLWCTRTNHVDEDPSVRTPDPSEDYTWRDVELAGLPEATV